TNLLTSVMQGEDLSTIYIDGKKSLRKEFFYEHPIINDLESIPDSYALVGERYKYILWPSHNVEEYFDLKKDPYELNNLIDNPAYQKQIERARVRFRELAEEAK
ncbi:MAG: sulfatase/phosphatase domain-containing protein, partial [Rikenellaceae bacterium]